MNLTMEQEFSIKSYISALAPDDGFYKSDTESDLVDATISMVKAGVPVADALEICESIYRATCYEFGE